MLLRIPEKTKLSGIATGAQVNVKPNWNAAPGNAAEILNKPTIDGLLGGLASLGFVKRNGANSYTIDTSTYQPLDADLTAIAAISGTSGLLRKTGANTWNLDTSVYLTAITKTQVEAVLTGVITTHTHNPAQINTNASNRFVTDTEKTTWNNKVDKVTGKGLSTEDYTTTEKNKLSGIAAGAQVNPTSAQTKIAYESNANTNAFTDTEKTKLSGIEAGAEVNEVNSVNSQTGEVELNAGHIPFNGILTYYLTEQYSVQVAIKELDSRANTNATNIGLKENRTNKVTNLDTPNNTTFPTTWL